MDITSMLVASAVPYIAFNGLTGGTYTYKARTQEQKHPIVDIRMFEKKAYCGSMLYLAVDANADLMNLKSGEKLYVGSQSDSDRMFRGDGMKGLNFHHAQMRQGNGANGLISYLAKGKKVKVFRISSTDLKRFVENTPSMARYKPMVNGQLFLSRGRDFAGYWFEQLILREEKPEWAWNTQSAHADAIAAMAVYAI